MTWDDENLSVRQGPVIGKSSERRMIDAMGGQDTIKKRFQSNNDGSVTMAHTRGPWAQPEFVTIEPPRKEAEISDAYLESGQLSVGTLGEYNPNHFDAGRWDASLIPLLTERWIAEAMLYTGEQDNSPAIVAEQESKSLPGDMERQRSSYWEKKKCIRYVPASIFTGKTRLWIQAHYGSKFNGSWPFVADYTSQPRLYCGGVEISSSSSLTSVVYYDSVNGDYFLLNISNKIKVYPMPLPAWAKKLRNLIEVSDWSTSEKARAEAYVLSAALPSESSSFEIDSPDNLALSPIAYGWKANSNGSLASVVDVSMEELGGNDYWFLSRLYSLSIARSVDPALVESSRWSCTLSLVEGPVRWMALFGMATLWVPSYPGELARFDGNTWATHKDFPSAPIYCYYDSGDNLVVVRHSRNHYEQSYPPEVIFNAEYVWPLVDPETSDWWFISDEKGSRTVKSERTTNNVIISVKYGEVDITGREFDTGSYGVVTLKSLGRNGESYNAFCYLDNRSPDVGLFYSISHGPGYGAHDILVIGGAEETIELFSSESQNLSIAMVVPFDDCEAFYCSKIETYLIVKESERKMQAKYRLGWYLEAPGIPFVRDGWSRDIFSENYSDVDVTPILPVVSWSNTGANKFKVLNVTSAPSYSLHNSSRSYPLSTEVHRTLTSALGAVCGSNIESQPSAASKNKHYIGGI